MSYRDSPFQALKTPMTWAAAAVTIIGGVVSLGLLFADHRAAAAASQGYTPARSHFDQAAAPVNGVLAAPVRWFSDAGGVIGSYFFAVSENRKLKAKVAELEQWKAAAIALKSLNVRYETLLKLRTEPPIPMVTARVVSDARGPFSNARLIDVGSADGVKPGNPAMTEHGVVGRVVGVTGHVSRLLLLTDIQSRTPVLIDRSNARGILSGDGGVNPKLEYARGKDPLKNGDMVLTSGDGGLYPRGLPVGVVQKDFRGVWRVRLYSDRGAVDFVRVLVFDDFSQVVEQAKLAAKEVPAVTPAEAAQIKAAAAATAAGGNGPKFTAPSNTAGTAAPVPPAKPAPVAATPVITPPPPSLPAPKAAGKPKPAVARPDRYRRVRTPNQPPIYDPRDYPQQQQQGDQGPQPEPRDPRGQGGR